jgi:hypothetical protein
MKTNPDTNREIQKELSEPFTADQIEWKPTMTKKKDGSPYMNNGIQVAKCTAHIDARAVMNRLDRVVGWANWSDTYAVINAGKNVECTLFVNGIGKTDVGQIGKDSSFADPMKSAYSDALKRAAVKFGIGRHLYDMEMQWLPFDGYRITGKPKPAPAQKGPTWPDDDEDPTPGDDNQEPDEAEKVKAENGKKVMSAVKFVEYLTAKLGFNDDQHTRATVKLLTGSPAVPNDLDKRKRLFEALQAYRHLRDDKKLSRDDALAALADEEVA